MKKAPQISSEGHVMLYYEDGSLCGDKKNGTKYSAKIHLICASVQVSICHVYVDYAACTLCVCVCVCGCACVRPCVRPSVGGCVVCYLLSVCVVCYLLCVRLTLVKDSFDVRIFLTTLNSFVN